MRRGPNDHLRTLRRRLEFLDNAVETYRGSGGAMNFMRAERAAITWAIVQCESVPDLQSRIANQRQTYRRFFETVSQVIENRQRQAGGVPTVDRFEEHTNDVPTNSLVVPPLKRVDTLNSTQRADPVKV